jgi:hypothetical protein
MPGNREDRGRGPVAVEDMRARLAAGWTIDQLWSRAARAYARDGFVYDYALFSAEQPKEEVAA